MVKSKDIILDETITHGKKYVNSHNLFKRNQKNLAKRVMEFGQILHRINAATAKSIRKIIAEADGKYRALHQRLISRKRHRPRRKFRKRKDEPEYGPDKGGYQFMERIHNRNGNYPSGRCEAGNYKGYKVVYDKKVGQDPKRRYKKRNAPHRAVMKDQWNPNQMSLFQPQPLGLDNPPAQFQLEQDQRNFQPGARQGEESYEFPCEGN